MIDLNQGYLDPLLLHQIRASEHEERVEAVRRARERSERLGVPARRRDRRKTSRHDA